MIKLMLFVPPEELYVSETQGSDVDGDGSEQKPFQTPLKVLDSFIFFHEIQFKL